MEKAASLKWPRVFAWDPEKPQFKIDKKTGEKFLFGPKEMKSAREYARKSGYSLSDADHGKFQRLRELARLERYDAIQGQAWKYSPSEHYEEAKNLLDKGRDRTARSVITRGIRVGEKSPKVTGDAQDLLRKRKFPGVPEPVAVPPQRLFGSERMPTKNMALGIGLGVAGAGLAAWGIHKGIQKRYGTQFYGKDQEEDQEKRASGSGEGGRVWGATKVKFGKEPNPLARKVGRLVEKKPGSQVAGEQFHERK
jgi:hypothetical protein